MSLDVIRVNDTTFSWGSCSFKLDDQPFTDIASIDASQKRERKKVYVGTKDQKPKLRTRGKYSVESVTMKVLKDTWANIIAYLANKAGTDSYGDVEFTMTLQAVEPGLEPVTLFFDGCTVGAPKDGHEEGIDELLVEVELDVMTIETNGLHLWSDNL